MSDLYKQVADALAGLAKAHGVTDAPSQPSQPSREYRAPVRRSAAIDERDSLARLRPTPAAKGQVSAADRHKYEGNYADVQFADGYVTVLVHTVEWKASAVRAYVMRLDKRTREYVTLDRLDNVRATEEA